MPSPVYAHRQHSGYAEATSMGGPLPGGGRCADKLLERGDARGPRQHVVQLAEVFGRHHSVADRGWDLLEANLETRFGELPDELRAEVQATKPLRKLDELVAQAARVDSLEEFADALSTAD